MLDQSWDQWGSLHTATLYILPALPAFSSHAQNMSFYTKSENLFWKLLQFINYIHFRVDFCREIRLEEDRMRGRSSYPASSPRNTNDTNVIVFEAHHCSCVFLLKIFINCQKWKEKKTYYAHSFKRLRQTREKVFSQRSDVYVPDHRRGTRTWMFYCLYKRARTRETSFCTKIYCK